MQSIESIDQIYPNYLNQRKKISWYCCFQYKALADIKFCQIWKLGWHW